MMWAAYVIRAFLPTLYYHFQLDHGPGSCVLGTVEDDASASDRPDSRLPRSCVGLQRVDCALRFD